MDGPSFFQILLDKHDLNAHSLAKKLKNASLQSGYQRFLERKSKEPKRATLSPAAEFFGINVEAFYSPELADSEWARITGAPPNTDQSASSPAQYPTTAEPAEGYCRLPVMAEAGAGNGCEALPEVVSYIDVLESYVRRQLGANPRTIKVLTARGNSMTGQIEDGDIMFVEQTDEFTDDGIYILTLDNLVRVKRLSVSALSQQVIIESNDGRKAEELPLKEVPHRLRIQGRVVGAWSLRRFS